MSRLCRDVGDLAVVEIEGDHGRLEPLAVDLLLGAVLDEVISFEVRPLTRMRLPPDSSVRLSRKPAATSIAMCPLRKGISGRVRLSLAGQSVSVISVLAQSPVRRASAAAATGSTVRVANRMSPLSVVGGLNSG